jgi:hypothetical protein
MYVNSAAVFTAKFCNYFHPIGLRLWLHAFAASRLVEFSFKILYNFFYVYDIVLPPEVILPILFLFNLLCLVYFFSSVLI